MNGLLVGIRRGRLSSADAARFTRDLAFLDIRIERPKSPANWKSVMELATYHKLTAYDAAYLELAKRLRLPLATLDGDLRNAAEAEGLGIVAL